MIDIMSNIINIMSNKYCMPIL